MSDAWFALTGLVHGSLGAAVLALLALAVWLERRDEDASFGSALLFASLLQPLLLLLGVLQRVSYDQHLGKAVLASMPSLHWWLLRKEHLAVGTLCLVWTAFASWWVGHRSAGSPWAPAFARAAVLSARLATALCLVVFTLGAIVAAGIERAIPPR